MSQNLSMTHVQKAAATVLLKKNGATDNTTPVSAFTSAPSIVTASTPGAPNGNGDRASEIFAHAPGSGTITFAGGSGPGAATSQVVCTVTQNPDTYELVVTLGPAVPQ